jgi:7,8-dihydropterin-6-yl-methyl-4-(beta-D-ribofuranosyl)aminobenzene 5'-phosphate synthase
MRFRVTVLCENSVGKISGTLGEHGFAALIETDQGAPVLFDTGQGATLLHNARRMNKNLAVVQKVLISHGHYDHAGGLMPLLNETGPKLVYGHPGIFSYRCRQKDNGERLDIGIPYSRTELESAGASFDLSKEFRQISPGLYLTGEIPRVNAFEAGDLELYSDINYSRIDTAPDDQSLVLDTEKGLVVVLGCCHSGIVNTLDHIEKIIGRNDFYAVIGGTHLGFCSQDQLDKTVTGLIRKKISKLAASHCTGFKASARLYREMPKQFQIAMVGYALDA